MRRGWVAGLAVLAAACGVAEAEPMQTVAAERATLEVGGAPDPWPSTIDGDIFELFPCDQVQAAGWWAVEQWPEPVPDGWTVEVSCDLDANYIGRVDPPANTIILHPLMSRTPELMVWIVGHEYGHALDFNRDGSPHREAWAAWRGYEPEPWCDWKPVGDDIDEPCGEWAETYSACVTGWDWWRSDLADAPRALDCAVMSALLPR